MKRVPWLLFTVDAEELVPTKRALMDFLANLPMSQRALAKELGVSHVTVGRWVAGKTLPSLVTLRQVVRVVKRRVAELQEQTEWIDQFLNALEDGSTVAFKDRQRFRAARARAHALLEARSPKRALKKDAKRR
jgi:transcriptional regulator with XRE-family HTH domain